MKKSSILIFALFVTLFTFSSCNKEEDSSPFESAEYEKLNTTMRVLWSDHALWTRNVIINFVDGTPGTTEAVNRLLKNQEDIGNAIKPYYGDEAGNALTTLLKEHITIAAHILTAAKAGDTPAYETALAAWYVNGDDIAFFLSNANPDNWHADHWKMMMNEHLDLTLQEAGARLNGDYSGDVEAYDKVYTALRLMADELSQGIALQFPDKF